MKTRNILLNVLLLSLLCGPITSLLVDLTHGSALTITSRPTVSTLKNIALTTTSDEQGSWNRVETWMLNVLAVVAFPISAYLLQSLHDVLDTFDDGSGDPNSRHAKLENIRNIHYVTAKIRRRSKRIFRLLEKRVQVSQN